MCIGNAGGGLIDLALFGILRGPQTLWYVNVIIGIVYAVVYYNVFKYVITKKNLKTPGRDVDTEELGDVSVGDMGLAIMEAVGGRKNIVDIDNCISRLRLVLHDTSVVDEAALKATGSLGVIRVNDENVQIVYGTKVEAAAHELKDAVKAADAAERTISAEA